jgi:hypothetical protein
MRKLETAQVAIDSFHKKGFETSDPAMLELTWIQTLAAVSQAEDTRKMLEIAKRAETEARWRSVHYAWNRGSSYKSPYDNRPSSINIDLRLDPREWDSIKTVVRDAIMEAWGKLRGNDNDD